jgi:hypothetical protein
MKHLIFLEIRIIVTCVAKIFSTSVSHARNAKRRASSNLFVCDVQILLACHAAAGAKNTQKNYHPYLQQNLVSII